MAEYSALKVAELKKLLGERKLSTAGNKPDLIARLEEADKTGEKPADSAKGTVYFTAYFLFIVSLMFFTSLTRFCFLFFFPFSPASPPFHLSLSLV